MKKKLCRKSKNFHKFETRVIDPPDKFLAEKISGRIMNSRMRPVLANKLPEPSTPGSKDETLQMKRTDESSNQHTGIFKNNLGFNSQSKIQTYLKAPL